jgi:hypothetical protein
MTRYDTIVSNLEPKEGYIYVWGAGL